MGTHGVHIPGVSFLGYVPKIEGDIETTRFSGSTDGIATPFPAHGLSCVCVATGGQGTVPTTA
jgi:hypothetical protein